MILFIQHLMDIQTDRKVHTLYQSIICKILYSGVTALWSDGPCK